jgi:hypothetical protein
MLILHISMVRLPYWHERRILLKKTIGNEAPEVSVEALFAADEEADPLSDDKRVRTLISRKR